MEIGAEISNKIRGAIKGKLQELGAYVDEELPDYIMVMVANKKTQEQMTDDLSLFLGSSTCKFTVWLHGVLEKLRSATSDPNSQKSTDAIIFGSSMSSSKSLSGGSNDGMLDEPGLAISRTRQERHDPRVSTSSFGQTTSYGRQHSEDRPAARLTSTVKPLRDLAPSEAIIDIQPNADDLIDEDLNFLSENPNYIPENTVIPENPKVMPENPNFLPEIPSFVPENLGHPRKKPSSVPLPYRSSRPTAALYRPPGSSLQNYRRVEVVARPQRLPQDSIQSVKTTEAQSSSILETLKQYEEVFGPPRPALKYSMERPVKEEEPLRKRKLPTISSVVKVKKFSSDGQEEEEDDDDEDDDYGSRTASLLSSVTVPAKPERRPTLPPCKQANKNLILKAISEAQESVTKTTNYSTVPQKQTVPVAPRTRMTQDGPMIEMIRAQTAPSRPSYLTQAEPPRESGLERLQGPHQRQDLFSRLRLHAMEEPLRINTDVYEVGGRPYDSRSFILKRPKLSEEIPPQKQPFEKIVADGVQAQVEASTPAPSGRLIQSRTHSQAEKPASPKFIVTLDGVPSPPGYSSEQEEEEMEYIEQGEQEAKQSSTPPDQMAKKPRVPQKISRRPGGSDGEGDNQSVPAKQKIAERCKYWPACKNGDSCGYHHPTAPCKAFPKCRFAEKCLFIHPNCKYDAKCTKPDCPYTHASRRIPLPQPMPVEVSAALSHGTYCRYDASCTKPDCPYTHASQLNPVLPPKLAQVPVTSSSVQQCRFFPACKKMECPFYHPKHCRYNTQCKRPDCTFYHPCATLPPRHAMKWTRPQTSE